MPKVTRLPTSAKRRVKNNRVAVENDGNVVLAGIIGKLDIPVERVLHQASLAGLQSAVVIGYDADGGFWFASSHADGSEALWLLAKAQRALLNFGED